MGRRVPAVAVVDIRGDRVGEESVRNGGLRHPEVGAADAAAGVDQAAPLISRLEQNCACLAIVESPIPQDDVEGNKLLRQKIKSPIAMHMGQPPVMTAIREGVCDGFVIGGGVRQTLSDGNLAERAQMPFWLQMVGTGLTTTFAAHLGSVLKGARWPAMPCVNIYSHTLLREFEVKGGYLQVPAAPGLGVELDREAVVQFVRNARAAAGQSRGETDG